MSNTPDTFKLIDTFAGEVFMALRNGAPPGWISDYVEYVSEQPSDGIPPFYEYLLFQIECEEEEPPEERQSNGGYLDALLNYVNTNHPDKHPHHCMYCGTYGHRSDDCPEMPMEGYTIRVHVPANMNGATSLTSYLSQFVQDGGVIVDISEDD